MSDPLTVGIIGGSLSGYAAAIYSLWRRLGRHKLKLYEVSGVYSLTPGGQADVQDMHVGLTLLAHNDTDEAASLTDVIGMMRYDKKKPAEEFQRLIRAHPNSPMIFSGRATNSAEAIPTTLGPHESKTISLAFEFQGVDPTLLDRYGIAHFMGFDRHGVPQVAVIVNEPITYSNPVIMRVVAHVDGKKIMHIQAGLRERGTVEMVGGGTIAPMEQAVLEKKFLDDHKY